MDASTPLKKKIDLVVTSPPYPKINKRLRGGNGRYKRDIYPMITEHQIEFVIGALLGDGYLRRSSKFPRLEIAHADSQKHYLDWKVAELGMLIESKPLYYEKTDSWHVYTITHPTFSKVGQLFYSKGKKFISEELLDSLTDFQIAIWFMDDGATDRGMSLELAVCSRSCEEVEVIQGFFKKRYDILSVVKRTHGRNPVIRFHKKDAFKLSRILMPYVIPSMKYKFEIGNCYHTKPIPSVR